MKLAILGSGFISRFYADSLVAQRRKDIIVSVYSRTEANAKNLLQIMVCRILPPVLKNVCT